MRYYYGCSAFEERLQVIHYGAFIIGIQCIGCFIKEDKFRVFIYSAGYENTLFLSLAQSMTFLSYLGIVPQG